MSKVQCYKHRRFTQRWPQTNNYKLQNNLLTKMKVGKYNKIPFKISIPQIRKHLKWGYDECKQKMTLHC
jgi:hypothetical protein